MGGPLPKVLTLRRRLVPWGVVVAGVALGHAAPPSPEAARARALYDAGSFAEAAPLLEKLAAAAPQDGILRHQLGVALEMSGQAERGRAERQKAIAPLEAAAEKQPHQVTVFYYLIGDYQVAGSDAKVKALLERIVALHGSAKLAPQGAAEQYQLASLLDRAGKTTEAAALFTAALAGLKAMATPPRRYLSDALMRAANTDVEKKDVAAALAKLDEAQKADPTHAAVRYVRGVVLDGQGKMDEARAEYEAALKLEPAHFYAQFNLANVIARQGKGPEALAALEKALGLDPKGDDLARTLLAAARISEALGQNRKAADLYTRLGKVKPGPEAELSARYATAHALVQEGKADEALKVLKDVASHAPDMPALRAEIAAMLMDRKDYQGAVSELLSALALAPGEGQLYLALGRAYRAMGKAEDARAAFLKAKANAATAAEAERELAAPGAKGR